MNETSAAYLNLMNRLTASRANRLRDVAQIAGQAQIASSNAWSQVPVQLAQIATGAMGQYQQDKQQGEMVRLRDVANQNDARRIGETERHNTALETQAATTATRTATAAEEEAKAKRAAENRAAGEKYLAMFGERLVAAGEEALTTRDGYQRNRTLLDNGWRAMTALDGSPYQPLPEEPDEQVLANIKQGVSLFKAAAAKPSLQAVSPGTTMLDTRSMTPVYTAPATPKEPGRAYAGLFNGKPAMVRDNPDGSVTPVPGFQPIPPRAASGGAGGTGAGGSQDAPVITAPPDEKQRNKTFPGTRLTFGTVWEQGEDWVLTGKETDSSRSADPKVKMQNAAIRNTGTAMIKDGSSLPQLRYEYAALAGTGKTAVKQYVMTKSYAESMLLGLDRARQLSGSYTRTSVPKANEVKAWWDRNIKGDTTLAEFDIWAYNTVRDYAKATSGSAQSIQQLTDDQVKLASMLLGVQQNPAQFERAAATMTTDVGNFLNKQREAVTTVNDSILGLVDKTFGKPYLANVTDTKKTPTFTRPPKNPKVGDVWQSPTGPTKWNGKNWL